MKRRNLLLGTAGALGVLGVGGLVLKPRDAGGTYNPYFQKLNDQLKLRGPGHPVMVLDLPQMNANIRVLTAGILSPKKYRIVVKSLPSIGLLKHVMQVSKTNALMVFHQPFLNLIAQELPMSDVLLGKPMPINAVRSYYREQRNPAFDTAQQVQWLVDSEQRVNQYLSLAKELGVKMRLNFELDVGLHRGGFANLDASTKALSVVKDNPSFLSFAGFMGYEPHLAGVADSLDHPAARQVIDIYRGHVELAKREGFDPSQLTLNGAGSHTIRLYQKDGLLNDLSAGSGVVKPSDFDTAHLSEAKPAAFIGTPVLKHYEELAIPGSDMLAKALPLWNPNTAQLFFVYGGYWKAKPISPPGLEDWMYHSSNQAPLMASDSVKLKVDDHVFFRPTQSEQVFLNFESILVSDGENIVSTWDVFS